MIPVTESMRPTPLWQRTLNRDLGVPVGPVTDEIRREAIRVLEAGSIFPDEPEFDRLYVEAERVLAEG